MSQPSKKTKKAEAYKVFKFWQKVLLELDVMNDKEFRIEYQKALKAIKPKKSKDV